MGYKRGSYRYFAEQDLLDIKNNLTSDYYSPETVCYHSEQYAEKMCKDKLVEYGVDPDWIHKIYRLLIHIGEVSSIDVPERILDCGMILDQNYQISRYPVREEDMTEDTTLSTDDAELAFECACSISDWLHTIPSPDYQMETIKSTNLKGKITCFFQSRRF